VRQRCANHPGREAAARCPDCRSFFCRECVTEHEGGVLCAACLRRRTAARSAPQRRFLRRLAGLLPAVLGVLAGWLFFFLLGRALLLHQPEPPDEGSIASELS